MNGSLSKICLVLFSLHLFALRVGAEIKHDFHTSLTEMNFNASTGSYEASLRVFSDDLLLALNTENVGKVIGDLDESTDPFIDRYLKKHFVLVSPDKKLKYGNYLGKEVNPDVTWIYVEFENATKLDGYFIFNEILTDQFKDQTNILNLIKGPEKKTILFDSKTKSALFPF